jgi:hypothetical protein
MLIFMGILRAHIKCPGERQFRRTLSSMEKVQNGKGGGGKPHSVNNQQLDHGQQTEKAALLGSLNTEISIRHVQ